MSEIPTRIRTQDLRFTSPILKSLRYDDMQPNRLIQTMQFNKTFKSLSCNSLSLGAVRYLNCLFSATSQNRRPLYKQVNNFGSLLFNIFMFNRAFIISMKIWCVICWTHGVLSFGRPFWILIVSAACFKFDSNLCYCW